MRILVADDHPVLQQVLRVMLTSWGYEVIIAVDGDDAWRVLRGPDPPPLAILDWVMPGMDGIEVCRRVRANPAGRRIYILILTAKTASEDLRAAMAAGADDYVTKPFNSQELRARLRAANRVLSLEEQLSATTEGLGRSAEGVRRTLPGPISVHSSPQL